MKKKQNIDCEIIDLQEVVENKRRERITVESELIDFKSKAAEIKRKTQARIEWYETRETQMASNAEKTLQILSYLKDVLNTITEKIFSIAGVEFQKTDFTCDYGPISARIYKLINTTDKKLFVSFKNSNPQKNLSISLAENEELFYDANTDFIKQLERDITTGTIKVAVTEIDENDAPERVKPKRVRPDLGFGLVD